MKIDKMFLYTGIIGTILVSTTFISGYMNSWGTTSEIKTLGIVGISAFSIGWVGYAIKSTIKHAEVKI